MRERVREARLQKFMAEFDRLKMKGADIIVTFVGKLSEISTKSASLGEIVEELKLVKKFLESLPRKKYIHIVASLQQHTYIPTTNLFIKTHLRDSCPPTYISTRKLSTMLIYVPN